MKLTLNKKNVGHVMQVLNGFFKKESFRFDRTARGPYLSEHGEWVETIETEYIPVLNMRCIKHPLADSPVFSHIQIKPLLALTSKYLPEILPLYEGDTVEYKGTQLLLRRQIIDLKFKGRQAYKHVQGYVRYKWFHQEISEDQKEDYLDSCLTKLAGDLLADDFFGLRGTMPEGQIFDQYFSDVYDEISYNTGEVLAKETVESRTCLYSKDGNEVYLAMDKELFEKFGTESQGGESPFWYEVVKLGETLLKNVRLFDALASVAKFDEEEEQLEMAGEYAPYGSNWG